MDYTKQYAKVAQQMSSIYRASLDNSINAMTLIQDNAEKMVNFSLEQSPWIPAEGRKLMSSWMQAYRKGYDDLKVAADEQYMKLEALVNLQKQSG